ncbi:UDP-glucose 4-epimerase [Moorella thermoacetica]
MKPVEQAHLITLCTRAAGRRRYLRVCDSLWNLVLEKALAFSSRAYDFRAISLRYFNAAGASPAGDIGHGGAGLHPRRGPGGSPCPGSGSPGAGQPQGNLSILGSGRGYSVLEVIKAAEKVTGQKVPYRVGPRRPGDPAVLVASAEKAMAELGWRPRYTELEDIIATAWQWHRRRPRGFKG